MASPFVASGISRLDGSVADGIHLLWTAPTSVGFSIDGFDIQRRPSQRGEPTCYTLTRSELLTLHQTFRVAVLPAQIAVKKAKCPEFPGEPPDEPAPEDEKGPLCVDFRERKKGEGPNPLKESIGVFLARRVTGEPASFSLIRETGSFNGLDCGFYLEIKLENQAAEAEITLVCLAEPADVVGLDAAGAKVDSATMAAPRGQPETLRLSGLIHKIVITSRKDETLLLDVCVSERSSLSRARANADLRQLATGRGANPRNHSGFEFTVLNTRGAVRVSQITTTNDGVNGLSCPKGLEIRLPEDAETVELQISYSGAAPKVKGTDAEGGLIAGKRSRRIRRVATVRLTGKKIRLVSMGGAEGLMLLQISAESDRVDAVRSKFTRPLMVEAHAPATGRQSAVAPLPDSCLRYDIDFSVTHYAVRVIAGLPSMLTMAMHDGKVVDTRLLSSAGGTQTAIFENRAVDHVLIYATRAATALTICTDVIDPKREDASWEHAPFIAKNIHLPVRNVNPALGSLAAQSVLASSRLLPGEAFVQPQFDQVAALMNDTAANSDDVSPMVQFVLSRERVQDPFIEIRGWPYAFAMLMEADWRRMLGFGFFDKGGGLMPGNVYDYRITGRFRHRDLFERLLGFHTIPLGTALPRWFHLGPVLLETPKPSDVLMFPKPPANALRAAGRKGVALRPEGTGGRCLRMSFADPVRKVVLEIEPGENSGFKFQAQTSDYFLGLSGSMFAGNVPASFRVELEFAEPVNQIEFFGSALLYGLRIPTASVPGKPDDVIPVSIMIPAVPYQSTPAPDAPLFLGTQNLQQPQLPGDPAITTQEPPQNLGFRLRWLPPPSSGTAVVPWPPDLGAFPPFDVAGFHLERRRVDTGGSFVEADGASPPVKHFGNRSSRREPLHLYPGIDLVAAFPEVVQPEPPVSVFMDTEDTLRSPAKPGGPPPGSLHQYRMFSVDAIGRRSVTPVLGSVVRLEKRIAPPQPVGPTTAPPLGVQRPVGVTARVLQSLDTRLTPSDRTLLGASTNAIVLEWAWTQAERDRDPFATEFRVYYRHLPPDIVRGSLTGVAAPAGADWQMTASLNQSIGADKIKGNYLLTASGSFKVKSHTAGQNITIVFERSAIDPTIVPLAASIEFPIPPDASELRPQGWPERAAIIPISAQENYRFVFRDRLTIDATHAEVRVWAGVSAADGQSYVPDAIPAGPNGGRPGNESSIVATPANARYLGRPLLVAPPPLAAVPEQVTNEPVNDAVVMRLSLPTLLPAVAVPAGFKVKLERLNATELLNRMRANANNTIGAVLPDGTSPSYTLPNTGDQSALLAQIRTGEGVRVEGRFLMDFLTRHLSALEPLWQSSSQTVPVTFGNVDETFPGKAERYIHRIRLVDQAGHVSAGGAIAPQFVRVPTLASPGSPSFEAPSSTTDSLTLTARIRDVFDLKWLLVFTFVTDATTPADPAVIEKPQLLRLPNRRDLYPNNGVRLRLANGTLLVPAQAVEVSTGVADAPDRMLTFPIAAGFGKRVSVWTIAMSRDGITSRLAGPVTAFTGPAPLAAPMLSVAAGAESDLASWAAASDEAELSIERSVDAGATWTRVTPWLRPAADSFAIAVVAGLRQYRLRLRGSQKRSAVGPVVNPS